ncbi:MAG TPA: T9SS type A sorting domain-containing protein, partial [Chitinophaga sp.]|nr:T9SS type A sorting domain-containing protein [Chitinophaga sp.]
GYSVLSVLDLTDPSNPVSTPVTTPGEGVVSGIVVLPGNNGNTVYVAAGDYVYLTKDGGLTWSNKSTGLEGLGEIRDLQLNPLDRKTLAVATPQGVYMTRVGQDKWTLSLADTDIRKIAFSDVTNGHIIAASYTTEITDTKLVYTYDGGRRWRELPAEDLDYLQCTAAMDFRFYNNCVDVYFATSDMGVVKYRMKGLYPHLLSEEANEKTVKTEWSVFPVPATTNINLSVKGLTQGDSYFVSIIDIRGKQVGTKQYNFQAGTSTISIPVDHLQNGMYVIVVQPKVGEAQTFKFIKQ